MALPQATHPVLPSPVVKPCGAGWGLGKGPWGSEQGDEQILDPAFQKLPQQESRPRRTKGKALPVSTETCKLALNGQMWLLHESSQCFWGLLIAFLFTT